MLLEAQAVTKAFGSFKAVDAASVISPEFEYVTYSTGTPSCAAISLPRSTGTPA